MFYRCELKYTTNYVNWILIRIIKENVLAKFTQLKYEVISKDNNEKLRKFLEVYVNLKVRMRNLNS